MRSQVTTKHGDKGRTVTISGDKLSKSHPILECCGDLDAARAETALCRLALMDSGRDDAKDLAEFLFWLLHVYFLLGSQCNDPGNKHPEYRKEDVASKHLAKLEEMQARFETKARLPGTFVVSASNELAGRFDLLCTTVRRLERSVVRLRETVAEFEADAMLAFLNRLSDCLYMMARYLDDGVYTPVDYSVLGIEDS